MKVSEMGWEVKKILRGQSKQYLQVSNQKTGKFLPRAVRIKFVAPFSKPCLPCSPLVAGGQGLGMGAGAGGEVKNLTQLILV